VLFDCCACRPGAMHAEGIKHIRPDKFDGDVDFLVLLTVGLGIMAVRCAPWCVAWRRIAGAANSCLFPLRLQLRF
jgi:hypothetical protein